MAIRLGQMESLRKSDPEILPYLPPAGTSLAPASPALGCVHSSPDQTWRLLLLKARWASPLGSCTCSCSGSHPAIPTTPHLTLSSASSGEQGL